MVRLLLGLAALVGLMWLAAWLGKATPAQRSRALKLIVLYGVAGALLLLVITGRIHWMFAAISAAVPWLQRVLLARQAWHLFKSSRGPRPGQTSKVQTAFLHMTLNHDSGQLHGEVISGQFTGRTLESLSLEELLTLLEECRQGDSQSAALLEAYLDRTHSDSWRERASADRTTAPAQGPMSTGQAADILGVSEEATAEEITDAHRRLIQRLHTDRGGTDYLAALINQARDTLTSRG
ncbi:MAG: hypothetical protein QF375_04615 [Arenicellales bacterium]|nr:hypothetical protein [Arenicellales bacterium]